MVKTRLEAMDRFDWNCVLCGKEAYCIHHCDRTTWNHGIDNLISLCQSCHLGYFHITTPLGRLGIPPGEFGDPERKKKYDREYFERFLKKERRKTRICGYRLNAELLNKARNLSFENNVSISSILNKALDNLFEERR